MSFKEDTRSKVVKVWSECSRELGTDSMRLKGPVLVTGLLATGNAHNFLTSTLPVRLTYFFASVRLADRCWEYFKWI